ncbi:hypothetical protein H4R34_002875 [Dimargaris verticillata]|uniref:Uncharacterized protein n=1 Tax=Dimargaris verticillata TaxID=2761393 RepID=A0A9W8B370_9FUNG|nr:hypothetical protein H4R34_002875 [Dimargaris verticillata]
MDNTLIDQRLPESSLTRPAAVRGTRPPSLWTRALRRISHRPSPTSPASAPVTPPSLGTQTPSVSLPVISQIFQNPKWKSAPIPRLPNISRNKPLAMYFLAEEKLMSAVALLELCHNPHGSNFKECADRVHMCQRILLNTIYLVYSGMDDTWKSSRTYRQYLPEEDQGELNRSFSESILFAAQALSRGFQIRGIEDRTDVLTFPATELCASLDAVRFVFRHRAPECLQAPYEPLYPVLCDFDRAWTTFERQLCFAYFDVGNDDLRNSGDTDITVDDEQCLSMLTVILSETVLRSLEKGIVTQDDIQCFEPSVIFAVPRLAIVFALLYTPDSLQLTDQDNAFWWFRPHVETLRYLRERLQCLAPQALAQLEAMLVSGDQDTAPSQEALVQAPRVLPSLPMGRSDRSRTRREGAPTPLPASAEKPQEPIGLAMITPPHSPHASELLTMWPLDDTESVATEPVAATLNDLFVKVCEVADGLHSGTFAKPFLSVLQKVFLMHGED